jgi:hypothetical protein
MKVDAAMFVRLRRLAPVLDDVLNAGEVEHADQAASLASLAQLCSQLFDAYHCRPQGEVAQATRHPRVGATYCLWTASGQYVTD